MILLPAPKPTLHNVRAERTYNSYNTDNTDNIDNAYNMTTPTTRPPADGKKKEDP